MPNKEMPSENIFSEINFRTRQLLWNALDHMRFNDRTAISKLPVMDIKKCEGRFFLNPAHLENIRLEYSQHFPDWKNAAINRADLICERRFDILGYENLSFADGNSIDWHLDPVNKIASPRVWWQYIKYLDSRICGDAKIIWELNRHQHLVMLGKAYALSGDDKYRNEFITQLNSWFEANPPKYGMNWSSSLELAYRSIAWIWAYHLFGGADNLPEDFLKKFFAFFELFAEHIEHNLSFYFAPNTHLTGEALGLFYIGILFPDFERAGLWLKKGHDILVHYIAKHVLADGGYVERSLWYHRYTLDIYLHFYILAKLNNITLPDRIEKDILKLGEFLMYASSPDRRFPYIGDDDGGRLMPIDCLEGDDLRGVFSTLSVIFNRGDFKYLSAGYQEEPLWLTGLENKKIYDNLAAYEPISLSKEFEDTGYFFMRDSWSEKSNYLAFDCGPHGWRDFAHAHADLLSFQINSGNFPIIVDPGTYTYVGDLRDFFRGASNHATIMVDGFYPATEGSPFLWKTVPKHHFVKWVTNPEYDYVCGSLSGRSLGWEHTREIFFIKPDVFIIVDSLNGKGEHTIDARFPLYDKEWKFAGEKRAIRTAGGPCSVEYTGAASLGIQLSDSWVSPYYGRKNPSYVLSFKGRALFPCKLVFMVNISKHNYRIDRSKDAGDTIFKILSEDGRSVVFDYNGRVKEV